MKDIDLVMSEGLGMRYAFIGPMETMHLNAPEGNATYMTFLLSFGFATNPDFEHCFSSRANKMH